MRAAVLMHYMEVAREVGFDPTATLAQCGLNAGMFAHQDQVLPSAAVIQLLEESARLSECETYGLRMGEHRNLSSLGAISLLLAQQSTLHDVLKTIISYRTMVNDSVVIHLEPAGRSTVLRQEIIGNPRHTPRQATELAAAVLFLTCRSLFGVKWQVSSVNFKHSAPSNLNVHRRLFHARAVFDSTFNGIVFPTELLQTTNPLNDPVMAGYAKRFIEGLSATEPLCPVQEVLKSIHMLLPMGGATIEGVSKVLAMNVRSLQRRLEEGGETFAHLVNSVRREQAMRCMRNPAYALAYVGEQLGYSNPGSFTRWFTNQFGMSPASWRAKEGVRYRRQPIPSAFVRARGAFSADSGGTASRSTIQSR